MKTKLKKINWLFIYKIQLVLNVLISIALTIISEFVAIPVYPKLIPYNNPQFYLFNASFIALAIIALTIIILKKKIPPILNGILIPTLPYFYSYLWTTLNNVLWIYLPRFTGLIGIVYFLGYLILYLPLLFVEYPAIKNNFLRLLSYICLFPGALLYSPVLTSNKIIDFITYMGIMFLILSIEWLIILTRIWNIHLKIDFPFYCKKWLCLTFYIVVIVFFLGAGILHISIPSVQGWDQLWSNWDQILANFDAHIYNFNLTVLVDGLVPGISEELERYFLLVLLLSGLKNIKLHIPIAIIVSSLIFGLSHCTHFLTEPVDTTISLIIAATGGGLLYAVVYLISGKLWLTIFAHTLLDSLVSAFSINGTISLGMWELYSRPMVIITAIELAIFLGFTLILLLVPAFRASLKINAQNLANLVNVPSINENGIVHKLPKNVDI